jgi:hypothetical protein
VLVASFPYKDKNETTFCPIGQYLRIGERPVEFQVGQESIRGEVVTTDPVQAARDIADARARLMAFAEGCSVEQWRSSPLGEADPRSVSVIVDHVADANDYICGWLEAVVGGGTVEVSPDIVDELNARHADKAAVIDLDEVGAHIRRSGDVLIGFVEGLQPDDLDLGEGIVGRFAHIAARHADAHRTELEAAFG